MITIHYERTQNNSKIVHTILLPGMAITHDTEHSTVSTMTDGTQQSHVSDVIIKNPH